MNQKGYILMYDVAPCHNSKVLRTFLECDGIPILNWPGNSPEMKKNYRERLEYNAERDWLTTVVFKRRDVEASM